MMIFNERNIWDLYEKNRLLAINKLSELEFFCGEKANITGLNGWVFEKTILNCINNEFKKLNIDISFDEQVPLRGRVKADLVINGYIAIELKVAGLFGLSDVEKYKKYRQYAVDSGYHRYIYLTWNEANKKYKEGLSLALEEENIFYLETPGEWRRFISTLKMQK